MEAALLKRTRANAGVAAIAGTFNGEPAIDFDERKSDAESAFPAAIQTLVSPGKSYDQDGPDGTRQSLIRWECFGLTSDDAFALAQAIIAANEPSGTVDAVRFGRSFLKFERPFPPETVGEVRIFRRIVDMEITATF